MLRIFIWCLALASCLFILACEPLVHQFDDIEDGILYKAKQIESPPTTVDTIKVMTWNIRFGIGRVPWFGDGCGDRVIFSKDEIYPNLEGLVARIREIQPDILMLQEVDVESKRTGYIDQVQWLLDHTYFNYGAYASMWQAQYVPSDGLGRINTGNAILSRWEITEAERIQLNLRGDQDALTKYFYLRRNILKTKIALPGVASFYVVNAHLDAFSTDDTKRLQIERVKEEFDKLSSAGAIFVAGGDFNLIPPGSDSTDFCDEDRCPGESFHGPDDNPKHKEGSFLTPEITWLQNLYDRYQPAVSLEKYVANQNHYFTSNPDWNAFWDRKIDYLFTNYHWVTGSDSTHQYITDLSDHIPVSARMEVPK